MTTGKTVAGPESAGQPAVSEPAVDPIRRYRFTVDDYYRMAEAGVFAPGERVELIEGEIVEMAAIGSRHAAYVLRLNRFFSQRVGDAALVNVQNPVRLSDRSEPEPDLLLLRPRPGEYADAHPGPDDVLLIVEVADSTLPYDRDVKLPLYARSGVAEVWIVDVEHERIDAYRDPRAGRYRQTERAERGARIAPAALPDLAMDASEVLGEGAS